MKADGIETRKRENVELGKAFLIFALLFFIFMVIDVVIQAIV